MSKVRARRSSPAPGDAVKAALAALVTVSGSLSILALQLAAANVSDTEATANQMTMANNLMISTSLRTWIKEKTCACRLC